MLKLREYKMYPSDLYNIKSAQIIESASTTTLGGYERTTLYNTACRIGDLNTQGYERGCKIRSKLFR